MTEANPSLYSSHIQSHFALRVRATGKLVRIVNHDGGPGKDAPELTTFRSSDHLPVYTQATLERMSVAMASSTPYYNATYDTPQHGDVDMDDVEIVKRVVTEELTPVQPKLPFKLTRVLNQRKVAVLLRRYAGVPEVPSEFDHFALFELPDGETLESINERLKAEVFEVGALGYVRLFKAFEVPEDYLPDLKGKAGFAAVTTNYVSLP